jgi:hypothetical protein
MIGLASLYAISLGKTNAADSVSSLPHIIDAGLDLWAKSGASGVDLALDTWEKGGLMEGDNKARVLGTYFRHLDRALGNYKSCERLEVKQIGQNSEVIYLAMAFEHGVVYGRFLMYHAAKDWVVQNMDFSTKPEAIMPWLAFEGAKYSE